MKSINPILSGEILLILDRMGHGDELVVADRNFPAHSLGIPVVAARGAGTADVIAAVLSVFPLDDHIATPLERMGAADGSDTLNSAHEAVLHSARDAGYPETQYGVIPRYDFYTRAATAFAVITTTEVAPYCDFIITKGVV
ncbi:RbsD/FucU domain-containing protein [Salinibacterium sp.]|uniref:RbsD/FucU family protein n=1 Tax=Salinibacterium sp. TaxID=1915057 RepID=UPI00286B3A2B|nr:RbsD/FucU domain-containing protein [Salinibacterium sp.]